MAAQTVFAPQAFDGAMALIKSARQTMAAVPGMQIDREPVAVSAAGRAFGRVDYSGVGVYRAMLATEIRCHLVSFVFIANDPALLNQAVSGRPLVPVAGSSGSRPALHQGLRPRRQLAAAGRATRGNA